MFGGAWRTEHGKTGPAILRAKHWQSYKRQSRLCATPASVSRHETGPITVTLPGGADLMSAEATGRAFPRRGARRSSRRQKATDRLAAFDSPHAKRPLRFSARGLFTVARRTETHSVPGLPLGVAVTTTQQAPAYTGLPPLPGSPPLSCRLQAPYRAPASNGCLQSFDPARSLRTFRHPWMKTHDTNHDHPYSGGSVKPAVFSCPCLVASPCVIILKLCHPA